MKLKEDNIDIYNNSAIILERKTPKFINSWIVILIVISLFFMIMSFIPFNIYNSYSGYVIKQDDKFYINLIVNKNDFPINKNNKLYIKTKKYKYKIISIEGNNVILSINFDNDIKINNNIVTLNVLKDRTTLFKILKNKIKKGFSL